jgi:SAM-dependent methyltransferase
MRADWNRRAREDANYYVAFGRRDQDESEFLSSAADVVRDMEGELKRLSGEVSPSSRRALEIGCGPGRLMRPLSRHFGEIHGIDISDELVAQAREKLRDIPWAFAHHANGSDLAQFPSDHFDFVYSYAVFQHIPSAEIVYSYLRETVRVLKPGGVARLQINSLPTSERPPADQVDPTWEGVCISAGDVQRFTRDHGVRLMALTGVDTQYLWTTWQKPPAHEAVPDTAACRIRHVLNSYSDPAVPASGSLARAIIEIENLPSACDLMTLEIFMDGVSCAANYAGPRLNGISQLNVYLPEGVRTGLVPLRIEWHGQPLCPEAVMRVVPPGPFFPRLVSVSDGVNLLSPRRIGSGTLKAIIQEVDSIAGFTATVDGLPVRDVQGFRADPRLLRYEVNFRPPRSLKAGGQHLLEIRIGDRILTRTEIEVV